MTERAVDLGKADVAKREGRDSGTAPSSLAREHEMHRRRRSRNMGLLAVLTGFVLLMFAVSIVKLGASVGNPSAEGGNWTVTIYEALFE